MEDDLTDLLRSYYADPSCGCCSTGYENPEAVAVFDAWLESVRADEREKAAQHLYRWDSLQPRPVNDGDDSLWSEMFRAYDLGASNVLADIRELLKEQSIKLIQTYVDGEQG